MSSLASLRRLLPISTIWRRLRPPRQLRVTREGKYFILLTFGVGIAAINTGNNLLYLLLGMLLALIIVSGVMSELSLRHLRVKRRLPRRAQAGRTYLVEIEVRNNKNKIPSYAIEVEDLRKAQPSDKRCFFLKISAQGTQVAAYRRKPRHRGYSVHTGFRIATRFPFGLFEKSLIRDSVGKLLVYPATYDLTGTPKPSAWDGPSKSERRGFGDGLDGVRPLRPGDDLRDIYWKKSTAPGNIVLKERSRETQPEATVTIDDLRPADVDRKSWDALFEKEVSRAASEVVDFIKRGYAVRLQRTSLSQKTFGPATTVDPLLSILALISPKDQSANNRSPSRTAVTLPPAKPPPARSRDHEEDP